jgi:phosphoglycerate-specific signal transduction histidine kinase
MLVVMTLAVTRLGWRHSDIQATLGAIRGREEIIWQVFTIMDYHN